jgi:hypothetical protein
MNDELPLCAKQRRPFARPLVPKSLYGHARVLDDADHLYRSLFGTTR